MRTYASLRVAHLIMGRIEGWIKITLPVTAGFIGIGKGKSGARVCISKVGDIISVTTRPPKKLTP
jgi:hypothetical protein